MRIQLAFAVTIIPFLAGCNSPSGASWAEADFNKYDKNYADFPVDRLTIGMPKAEVERIFGPKLVSSGADASFESYTVEKWVSAPGPDFVGEHLHLRFKDGRLSDWHVERPSQATIVPRSW